MGTDGGSNLEQIVAGGIQETAPTEIVGGLTDPEAKLISGETGREEMDPIELLNTGEISIEKFFGLDWNKVVAKLSSMGSLGNDNTYHQRWDEIVAIHDQQREGYVSEHPGKTEIKFQTNQKDENK